MKEFTKMTEAEILALTDEQVEIIIKLVKANAGLKLIEAPEKPKETKIPEQSITVYQATGALGGLAFPIIEDLEKVLDVLRDTSFGKKDYNYNKTGSDIQYFKEGVEKPYGSDTWDSITSSRVYSVDQYNAISDDIKLNKEALKKYEIVSKEYQQNREEAKTIEDEIYFKISEVHEKYRVLNWYCQMMRNDYMPLSEDNEKVAIKFLDKAYTLSSEEKEYVLSNYQKNND